MPRQTQELNNFTGGLHTESSAINAPENTCAELVNFELERDGSVRRRRGFQRRGFTAVGTYDAPNTTTVLSEEKGYFVRGLGKTASVGGGYVMEYNHKSDNPLLGLVYNTVPLGVFSNVVYIADTWVVTSNNGLLIGDVATQHPILVRDVWGVQDNLEDTERPVALSVEHKYNLTNQGWPWTKGNELITGLNYGQHLLAFGHTGGGALFPANVDLYSLGKNDTDDWTEAYSQKNNIYNRPAAKGKHILDFVDRSAGRNNELQAYYPAETLPDDYSNGVPTCLAVYSGRLWMAGQGALHTTPPVNDDRAPHIYETVFFSQVVKNKEDINKFYQQNDPTDPDVSDLLPTDGGTLTLPGMGRVLKLVPLSIGLLVVSDKEVRFITGPDGVFRADDFSVDTVAKVGAIDAASIISLEDSVMFAAVDGIYVVAPDPQSGRLAASNITRARIHKEYKEQLSQTATGQRRGATDVMFDRRENKVRWLFSTAAPYKELVYDMQLDAFYINEMGAAIDGFLALDTTERAYSYLANNNTTTYLIDPEATSFQDDIDGTDVPYTTSLSTNPFIFGDTQRDKWLPYITTHFTRTEDGFIDIGGGNLEATSPSGCMLQARWNFANSAASGKWGTEFQAYRYPRLFVPANVNDPFDWGEEVISTKNRIRGSGKALQLKFTAEDGKDCQLLGWGMVVDAGESV